MPPMGNTQRDFVETELQLVCVINLMNEKRKLF